MAYVPTDWKDFPDTSTPLSAAALEAMELQLADWADAEVAAHSADTTSVHGITNTANLVLTDDARLPTSGQKAALAGTTGTPGSGNKFVTATDAALSDPRPPEGVAGGALSGFYPDPDLAESHRLGYAEVVTKSADYTAGVTDYIILVSATGAARTITLPAASGVTGKGFIVKKIDSSVNTVTIGRTSPDTIDGANTQVLTAQYDSLTVVSNGTNWYII